MHKKGFTLIEILIVIAIMAILSAVTVISFVTFRNSQTLDRDSDIVVAMLRQARAQTLSSQNASVYGVHFASSTVTVFTGATYSASDPSNTIDTLTGSDTVLTLSLTGGGSDIVFKRLSGETDQNGTIVLQSKATSRTRTVTVYKTGLIEFN